MFSCNLNCVLLAFVELLDVLIAYIFVYRFSALLHLPDL